MKTIIKNFVLLCIMFAPFQLIAQEVQLKGSVKDASTGESLIGASVSVAGTTTGTITDFDGNFTLTVPANATLNVTYVGYQDLQVQVGGRAQIDITLTPVQTELNQVVVVGYGTQRVKDLTASISTVKGADLSKQQAANPAQALQGRVAGVQVVNSGVPGSTGDIRIRGQGSIGSYGQPLYVVDGAFVDNISFLNPADIEDITVLKDASSAAIYGVRAANGVLLITTRRGTGDVPVVNADSYVGVQVPVNIMPLANKNQYVELLNEANANTTGYVPKDPNAYPVSTDWYKELVRNAIIHNHNIDVSGTTPKSNYTFGANYFYQEGIMDVSNYYWRYNLRGRYENNITDWLKASVSTIVSQYNSVTANQGAYFNAFVNPPVYPVYDETNMIAYPVRFGSPQQYGFGNQYGNPVAAAYYSDNLQKGAKLVFVAALEFNIIKNKLSFRTSYNQDLSFYNTRNYTPQFLVGGSQSTRQSSLNKEFNQASTQIIDNLLTFNNISGKSTYSLLLGHSMRLERNSFLNGSAVNVPGIDEQSKYLTLGSVEGRFANDGGGLFNGLSFFTRGTYNYANKYLLTVTFRADGSLKYQQKWGYFPSIGIGWILSEEDFMNNQNIFQYLKLRASWGMLGNDNIPANSFQILGLTGTGASAVFGNRLVTGQGAQTVYQNYLKWESVSEWDGGIDFSVLNERLKGSLDYYHRITNRVVFEAPIATGGGVANLLGNNGSVLNNGIELNLNWGGKAGEKFGYQVSMNATTIHNKVLKLTGSEFIPGAFVRGNYTTRTQVGHPIGAFYGYEIDRVYQSEAEAAQDPVYQVIKDRGYFKYKDQNGDNTIDANDRVFLGSPLPWLMGGIDFGLNYGNLDFSLTLQGQAGNKVLNAKRMNRDVFPDANYDLDFYKNAWRPGRTSSEYPSAEAYNSSFIQQANDFFVEDASYIRLQNVQVGYSFRNIKNVKNLRVYLAAQRPLTIFGYNGFTPEVGGSPISNGIDFSVYPMQAIYSLGVKINF